MWHEQRRHDPLGVSGSGGSGSVTTESNDAVEKLHLRSFSAPCSLFSTCASDSSMSLAKLKLLQILPQVYKYNPGP